MYTTTKMHTTLKIGDIVKYKREYRDENGRLITNVKAFYTIEWNENLAAFTMVSPLEDVPIGAGLVYRQEDLEKIGNRFMDEKMYTDIKTKAFQTLTKTNVELSPEETAKRIIALARAKGLDLEKLLTGG